MGKENRLPAATTKEKAPSVYLDLRAFVWIGLGLILILSPLMRGLFFEPDLVLTEVAVGLVALVTVADMLMKGRAYRLSAMEGAVLALALAYALAIIGAVDLRGAIMETMKYITYALVFIATVYLARSPRDASRILALLWLAAVITALVGILAAVKIFPFPGAVEGRVIASTFQYKNALAAYLLAAFIIGLGLVNTNKGLFGRVVVPAGNFILLLVLFNTFSRGAWILMPIVLIVYSLLLPRDRQFRNLYHIFLTIGVGFFAGRYFVQAVAQNHLLAAEAWVVLGAAATAGGSLVYDVLIRLVESWRAEDTVKKVTANVLAAFLVLNVGAYVYYAYASAPALSGEIIPGRIKSYSQTIHPGEGSYDVRSDYYRTALAIARDYPINGTGGRGWASIYHRYQPYLTYSTEVHNHYLQVLVEAGIIGLAAYLALWVLAGFTVYRLYRTLRSSRPAQAASDVDWVLIWAGAAAALTIGIHSFYDFDLSLPAVAVFLWTLFGVIRSGLDWQQKYETEATPKTCIPTAITAVALSLIVIIPAWRFNAAGHLGALGAQALAAENFYEADQYYTKAVRLDPFQATYHADLAQIYAVSGLKQKDPILIKKAWAQLDRASKLKPYDPKIRAAVVNTAQLLGDRERAVKEAELLLDMNPLDVTNYELITDLHLALALDQLAQGEKDKAQRSFKAILDNIKTLEEHQNRFARRYPAGTPYWQGRPLAITERLMLRQAQALAAQGEYDQAESLFRQVKAEKDEATRNETRKWLAAVYLLQGDEASAGQTLAASPRPAQDREEALRLVELLRRIPG
ncbi:MAG TPA: hypothetical protein GXX39_05565 [Syntrophothermus lipocalidus]|nr:hypothetical protein [Syntrophothermus lipocalidus]